MGKFVLVTRKNGRYQFDLVNRNGHSILHKDGYHSKASALNGIASVKKNAENDNNYKRKKTKDAALVFTLAATNGKVIGTSERYENPDVMEKIIMQVKKIAPSSAIDDLTK
ncbi:MAG: YegP family protein [Chitinophagaceae bacterium]|nr:YegP family protein [Chitinophagaceae bacterium]